MIRQLSTAVRLFAALTLVTGVAYPLVVTLVARVAFREAAGGSLVLVDGVVRGSELVGQPFDDARWFWGRPSATARMPYDAAASTGSNLGPTNAALRGAVAARVARLRALPGGDRPIPVDLVTASGSGLDPHVSPAAARFQVERVAAARGLPVERVRALVESRVEPRLLGIFGEPRVNVLLLNLALDGID